MRRHLPYAFTEQGVAMLSTVLKSERAIAVNILIMRAFVRIRKVLTDTAEFWKRVEDIERRVNEHGEHIAEIIEAIEALGTRAPSPRTPIGFRPRQRRVGRLGERAARTGNIQPAP